METYISNELLSCKICLNPYDDNLHKPLSIYPCGHTYCLACLEQLVNQTCPECRADIDYNVYNWELLRIISSRLPHYETSNDEEQPLIINNNNNRAFDTSAPRCSPCSQCLNSLKTNGNRLYSTISNLPPRDKLLLVYFIFILMPILLIYPFTLTYIGIQDEFKCTIDPRIPAWTITYGCGFICMIVIFVSCKIYFILKASPNDFVKRVANTCLFLLALFELAWFFVGCVWIFSAYGHVNFVDEDSANYCQHVLFKCAFGTLIFQCIAFGLAAIVFTCCMCKQMN